MPTRGSPARSSCASGCLATKSISALTSRPSKSLESTSTVPPELPKPRASQVSTLKPALRSAPTPTLPTASSLALSGFVSREPPQPWPSSTVGCFPAPSAGMNESWIWVPSNDVTVASRAWAAGAEASSRKGARANHARVTPGLLPVLRPENENVPTRAEGLHAFISVQARQCGGHVVLHGVGLPHRRGVHEERERDALAAGRAAVAGERRDIVQRAGLRMAAVLRRRPAHALVERPVAPDDGQRRVERLRLLSPGHPAQQPHDLARARAIEAREARAVGDLRRDLEARDRVAHDRGAGLRAARRAVVGAKRLHEHLGDVVVRRLVHRLHDRGELR